MNRRLLEKPLELIPKILIGYAFVFLILRINALIAIMRSNLLHNIIPDEKNSVIILLRFLFMNLSEDFIVPLWAMTLAFSIRFITAWIKTPGQTPPR